MALRRGQIERLEHQWEEDLKKEKNKENGWWRNLSRSRRYLKKQMNRYIRRQNKKVDEDDASIKSGRKPYSGSEYDHY